jgi:hypothetical protein
MTNPKDILINPPLPETATVEIGREYGNWLDDKVAEPGGEWTRRKLIERALYHLRRASDEEREAILRGDNTRPLNRIGEIIEVLPATASVFRK